MRVEGKIAALVVAAGSGRRAAGETNGVPKQYAPLAGRALLAHALDGLDHPLIDEIRVVIGAGQDELYRAATGSLSLPPAVTGGDTRQQSVSNGLEAIAAAGGAAAVLIHDAARPFLPPAIVAAEIAALEDYDGVVPALPVVDSLALASAELGDPVSRDNLVRVQTPQAFRFDRILAAHRSWSGAADATDDAQVARTAGMTIGIVAGDPGLEKLTFAEDFVRAEQRLTRLMVSRTGLGFDVHAFATDRPLWLGGLLIPHDRGLAGHSDADVVLHALTDAILGAIGGGDIGDHFPPGDLQWRGAQSAQFVEHARLLVEARGGRIDHVDVTIICEAPRIGPHRPAMRARVADLLRLPITAVSIKATTTERLGFTGRGEGIAAQALASVRLPEES